MSTATVKLVIASGNQGKITEIKHALKNTHFELISQNEFNVAEAEENGLSFIENALIKARNAARHTGLAALADDSGLVVDALCGAPGIYSARYAGPDASDEDNVRKLLQQLKETPNTEASAHFHCAMAFVRHEKDAAPIIAEGVWHGRIVDTPKGENGFGYDPIFYLDSPGCTAAELSKDEKNSFSHRGLAIKELSRKLEKHLRDAPAR